MAMIDFFPRPNDRRGFIHKKVFGFALDFVPGGGIAKTALSIIGSRRKSKARGKAVKFDRPIEFFPQTKACVGSRIFDPRTGDCETPETFQIQNRSLGSVARETSASGFAGFLPSIASPISKGCILPWRRDPVSGECKIFVGDRVGPDNVPLPSSGPGGGAVMGRYGAGMVAGSMMIDRADCSAGGSIRGMVLGNDGICYNRRDLKNSERMWPRGRRPLLTGGEMRSISIAARAAARLTRTAGRLQDIGLIKKPIVRRSKKKN